MPDQVQLWELRILELEEERDRLLLALERIQVRAGLPDQELKLVLKRIYGIAKEARGEEG